MDGEGKRKLTVEDAKKRIVKRKDGKRYVLVTGKKRLKVKDDNISERALIKWIIEHLRPRRRRKGAATTKKLTYPDLSTIDRSFSQRVQAFDEIHKLKMELKDATAKAKEALPALPPAVPPKALPPATWHHTPK